VAQSKGYRRYTLILLTVILGFAFVDRFALGILSQDIKTDLHLSDTQLGFLSGIAFSVFYSVMGIPIARWADRGNRLVIVSLTTALWSVAVALCGAAGSFAQLMLIRVGVAVGEAGALPCGTSLIADYFNRAERPRAMAVYTLAAPLAVITGFFLAGWWNQLYGWRVTFMLIGAPGVIVAAMARLSLREPRLANSASGNNLGTEPATAFGLSKQPDLREVFATLWANATFRHLLLCLSVLYFFAYGNFQWQPSYFMRTFGLTSGQVGSWFAAIFGLGGLLGTYLGGELASRFAAHNERLQLGTFAIVMVNCGVISVLVFVSSNLHVAFGLLAVVSLGLYVGAGPLYAIIQTLAPPRMRAASMAIVLLVANLIGMGLGPLATGALSDLFHERGANDPLRYALVTMSPGYLLVAWFAWRASRTVTHDLADG
jgi:MFS family permease